MHRRLIHRTFRTSLWPDGLLLYLGVIVGMAGPFAVLRIHDIRDWAQRRPECHDFFAHRRSLVVDAFWNLNCRFEFENPPTFSMEPETAGNGWYRFLERTWMLQQLPVAIVLFAFGGWGLLTMGECWHNNHHAFPESARIGFEGQLDPGWKIISGLEHLGLASSVGRPRDNARTGDLSLAIGGQIDAVSGGRG